MVPRDWCEQLTAGDPVSLARRHCRLLPRSTGVSEAAIDEWGFLERGLQRAVHLEPRCRGSRRAVSRHRGDADAPDVGQVAVTARAAFSEAAGDDAAARDMAAATAEVKPEQVRRTVIHEVAHHFGIDDVRLDQLGW